MTSAAEWAEIFNQPPHKRTHYTDKEIAEYSGINIPSLLRLQTNGAIEADKAPRVTGGFFRTWHINQVAIAAIIGDMQRYIGWRFDKIALITKSVPGDYWGRIVATSISDRVSAAYMHSGKAVPVKSETDWSIEIYNNFLVAIRSSSKNHPAECRRHLDRGRFYVGCIVDEKEVRSVTKEIGQSIESQMTFCASLNISIPVRRAYAKIEDWIYKDMAYPEDIRADEWAGLGMMNFSRPIEVDDEMRPLKRPQDQD